MDYFVIYKFGDGPEHSRIFAGSNYVAIVQQLPFGANVVEARAIDGQRREYPVAQATIDRFNV